MADGSTKAIKDIKVGDLVLATDPETGEQGPRRVTHLWIHQDVVVNLRFADGSAVTTTEDHPFWNHSDRQWQEAQRLDRGDLLHTSRAISAAVEGIDWKSVRHEMAYNLTVDDIHTYHVMADDSAVLVHNCGGSGPCVCSTGDVVPYRPTHPGLENHHAVLDVWAKHNVPGYKSRASASTTVALTKAQHDATKVVYRDWLEARTGRRVGGKVNWKTVSSREILDLSERMFDAAGVPQAARSAYYSEYNSYLYGLG
jgi:hypothetical protein